ncbi:hypothetical protein Syun_002613 [Stephania yunnanensis]|uniref:Uncharacterized protein n=1 Tax=Stephania yunnanensis TaxID=152371 RepID=A0AAP0LFR2_9MAGN
MVQTKKKENRSKHIYIGVELYGFARLICLIYFLRVSYMGCLLSPSLHKSYLTYWLSPLLRQYMHDESHALFIMSKRGFI